MSSAAKQREVVQVEALQRLVHEKQEEIEDLNRKIDLLVRCFVCSGVSIREAFENVKSLEQFLKEPLRLELKLPETEKD